jgi:hypothetical protein
MLSGSRLSKSHLIEMDWAGTGAEVYDQPKCRTRTRQTSFILFISYRGYILQTGYICFSLNLYFISCNNCYCSGIYACSTWALIPIFSLSFLIHWVGNISPCRKFLSAGKSNILLTTLTLLARRHARVKLCDHTGCEVYQLSVTNDSICATDNN